jgi:hypothetical protein
MESFLYKTTRLYRSPMKMRLLASVPAVYPFIRCCARGNLGLQVEGGLSPLLTPHPGGTLKDAFASLSGMDIAKRWHF